MTKDRLKEFRTAQKEHNCSIKKSKSFKNKFLQEVEQIRDNINKIQTNVEEVKKSHSAILSAPKTDDNLRKQLQDLTADIKSTANKVINGLNIMERNNKQLTQTSNTSADLRIRRTQHSMLSKMFVDLMTDYYEIQSDYRQSCQKRIRRQLEITGRSTNDEEIEQMIERGGIAIFTQDIVTDTQITRQMMADIEVRHKDLIKLETSIRELHDMFIDLALFCKEQGELINNIEYNVEKSYQEIDSPLPDLISQTKRKKKNYRKKIKRIMLVVLGVTVVGGLIIF